MHGPSGDVGGGVVPAMGPAAVVGVRDDPVATVVGVVGAPLARTVVAVWRLLFSLLSAVLSSRVPASGDCAAVVVV